MTALPVRGLTNTALLADPNQEPDIASYDFGFIGSTASLGDRIWSDTDGDGVQDAGEPGIGGVRVFLDTNGNGVLDAGEPSQTTDASGNYTFTGLTPGTYRVVVDATTLPANATPTGDLDGVATPSVAVAILTGGQARTDVDFGYRLSPASTASISSSIWSDLDGDGERDEGESGIAGVTVTLTDEEGNVVATTTTDANGNYRFTGLPPGTYIVTFTPPPGYTPSTDESYTITLDPGEAVTNVSNFGLQPQAPPPPPPPTDIPTLSEVAMLALLALLLLAGWRTIDQTARRRTRG